MTGGKVKIKSAKPEFSSVISKLELTGALISSGENWVEINMNEPKPKAISLTTGPSFFSTRYAGSIVSLNALQMVTQLSQKLYLRIGLCMFKK